MGKPQETMCYTYAYICRISLVILYIYINILYGSEKKFRYIDVCSLFFPLYK